MFSCFGIYLISSQTKEGLPALLVYKGGQTIGNFVKLEDTFGQDFFASDVESFLIENDILTEELECQLTASVTAKKEDDSDSDLDIDWQIHV